MEKFEDFLDAVSKLELVSVGKDSKIDVSAVRIDHRNAKYGLVNCDNFSLQLILQEKATEGADLANDSDTPTTIVSETQGSGSAKGPLRPLLKNTRIGSYFSFESPDVINSGVYETEAVRIHFLNKDKKTLSVYDGAWDINVARGESGLEIQEDPLTQKVSGQEQSKETLERVRTWLPISAERFPLYRNNKAYCALAKLKLGTFFDIGPTVLRFSESGFVEIWALELFKRDGDSPILNLRDEMHIVAIGAGK